MEVEYKHPIADQSTKLQRLNEVKSDPNTMNVVAQRVADGETLRDIAQTWNIQFGLFQLWIMGDRERFELYEAALRARADEEVHNAIKIADDEYQRDDTGGILIIDGRPVLKDTARARLQVKTRLSVSKFWDSKRFGAAAAKEEKLPSTSNAGIGEAVKILSLAFEKLAQKETIDMREVEDAEEI